jgi:hypothetical protein
MQLSQWLWPIWFDAQIRVAWCKGQGGTTCNCYRAPSGGHLKAEALDSCPTTSAMHLPICILLIPRTFFQWHHKTQFGSPPQKLLVASLQGYLDGFRVNQEQGIPSVSWQWAMASSKGNPFETKFKALVPSGAQWKGWKRLKLIESKMQISERGI